MAVYVDDYGARFKGMRKGHMMADTEEELDAMAEEIGLEREGKQTDPTRHPFYAVSAGQKMLALKHGAVEVTAFELARMFPVKKAVM